VAAPISVELSIFWDRGGGGPGDNRYKFGASKIASGAVPISAWLA
jgi:hypothetical protein